jgi:hypothetical protein
VASTPAAIAADLHAAVDAGLQLFQRIDETRTARPPAPGKWCAREVLGHLVDSACNNHRRFVLGQDPGIAAFDGYDGDVWVARQRYTDVPFRDIVALWCAYNRHLAHVIVSAAPGVLAHTARSPEGQGDVTLGFLMEDYVVHLRHHLEQLRALLAA